MSYLSKLGGKGKEKKGGGGIFKVLKRRLENEENQYIEILTTSYQFILEVWLGKLSFSTQVYESISI